MKKIFKILLFVVLVPLVLFLIFLSYSTINDYSPNNIETIDKSKGKVIDVRDTLNVFNWNIGYAGLGDDMSFFYDGGEQVRTNLARAKENFEAILRQLNLYSDIDFYLLQEVDLDSKRSYNRNQYEAIAKKLPNYSSYFAFNYKVNFVPVPPKSPLGRVLSGLASYSLHQPFSVVRSAFKGNYAWPTSLFMLDRCFMVQRFYISNGTELILINTHNSAYDDGSLRFEQMKMLRNFLLSEYKKGNYVVVGGDWNQMPPNDSVKNEKYNDKHLTRLRIKPDFIPTNWSWVFSEQIPTNRMINESYNPETTITSTIDFFLLSPNVSHVTFKVIDLQFKYSDHQPLLMSFVLDRGN